MSILKNVLAYQSEKHNYTIEEQARIEWSFKQECNKILSKAPKSLVDALEDVNRDIDNLNED